MSLVIIQLVGFVGTAAVLWSFQQNKRSVILVYLIIGQVFFATHYGLLAAWSAVAINLIGIIRGIIFYYKPLWPWASHSVWPYLFIGAIALSGYWTWGGWYSSLILVAMSIETLAVWRNKPSQIRWLMLVTRPLFFTYSLIVGSYAGMVADILISTSLIAGMIRFDRKT